MPGPKDLSKEITSEHHKAPTLEDIIHRLAGSTTHLKVDAKMVSGAYISHT